MARVQRPSQVAGAAAAAAAADTVSWYCAVLLVALILLGLFNQEPLSSAAAVPVLRRSCDEIYVVEEGETLHTISDKCGDPYIVERNPHIHDPDDVFPGLVIRLSPSTRT